VIEDKPVVAVVRQLLDDAGLLFLRGSADSGDTFKPLAESLSKLIDSARTLFDSLSVEHHQKKMLIINLKLISGKYAQKNEISG
jgi:hypothetical protein